MKEDNFNIDMLHSKEIEDTVIGIMINNNNSCVQALESNIKENDFYYSSNRILFKAISNIFNEKNTIDLLMLLEYLKNNELLPKVGGVTGVTNIENSIITTSNLLNYIELLKEYSRKRKLVKIADHIKLNINKSVEEVQQEVTGLLNDVIDCNGSMETTEEQGTEYLKMLERRIKGEDASIKTGISRIDDKINGFNGGDLITIFAFSGVGKTALATQITLNNIRKNKKVLFFSLEMPKEQIRDRIISNLTGIQFKNIRYGKLSDKELVEVVNANNYISSDNKLLISEEDDLLNITSKIQFEVMKNNIDIIFIDYINLINIMGNNKEEFYRVAECTRLLKKLAIKINKPIVILAQGKQEQASKMTNKNLGIWEKVAVNDIGGGASIYRDSDTVIGMYRNVELDNELVRDNLLKINPNSIDYNSKIADKNPNCINILIKKSRSSGKDIIACRWKPENYRISNWY